MTDKDITKLLPIRCLRKNKDRPRRACEINLGLYFECKECTGYDNTCRDYITEEKQ